jgi:molecular chaperone GrpE (heat shock protein)
MSDGSIMKFENGVLMEIAVPDPNTGLDELKKENEALKAEIESLKETKKQLDNVHGEYKALATEFKNFRSQFNAEKPNLLTPEVTGEKKGFSFKRK